MKTLLLTLALIFTLHAQAGDPLKSKEDWERALYVEGVVIKLTALKDFDLKAFEGFENKRHKDRHLTITRFNDYSIEWDARPNRRPLQIKKGSVLYIYPYQAEHDVFTADRPHPDFQGFSAGYFKGDCAFSTMALFECQKKPLRLSTLKSDFAEIGLKMELVTP